MSQFYPSCQHSGVHKHSEGGVSDQITQSPTQAVTGVAPLYYLCGHCNAVHALLVPSQEPKTNSYEGLLIALHFLQAADRSIALGNKLSEVPLASRDGDSLSRTLVELDRIVDEVDLTRTYELPEDRRGLLHVAWIVQARALQTRFRLLGQIPDIDRSILLFQSMLDDDIICNDPALQTTILINHASSVQLRYNHTGDARDLAAVIDSQERLLLQAPYMTAEERLEGYLSLTSHLRQQLYMIRCQEAHDNVLQLCDDSLQIAVGMDPANQSRLYGDMCITQSVFGEKAPNLSIALGIMQRGHDLANARDKAKWQSMCCLFLIIQLKLALITGDQYYGSSLEREIASRNNNIALFDDYMAVFAADSDLNLDAAIEALQEAYLPWAEDLRSATGRTVLLTIALLERYNRFGHSQDLRNALSTRLQAHSLLPFGTYCIDITMIRCAAEDFGFSDAEEIEDKLIKALGTHAIQGCPNPIANGPRGHRHSIGHHNLVYSMCCRQRALQPGQALQRLLVSSGIPISCIENIALVRSELSNLLLSTRDFTYHFELLCALADLHFIMWDRQHELGELVEGLECIEEALAMLDNGDWNCACLAKAEWARRFLELRAIEDPDDGVLKSVHAHNYLRAVATDPCHFAPSQRLESASNWFKALPMMWQQSQRHTMNMCRLSLAIIKQFSREDTPATGCSERAGLMENLLTGAVICSFLSGENNDNIIETIRILITGQAIVRNGRFSRRVPNTSSQTTVGKGEIKPQKPSTFAQPGGVRVVRRITPQAVQAARRAFEDFRTFQDAGMSLEDIMAAASDGPIVIIMSHPTTKSIALIILPDSFAVIELPIKYDTLKELNSSLRSSTTATPSNDQIISSTSAHMKKSKIIPRKDNYTDKMPGPSQPKMRVDDWEEIATEVNPSTHRRPCALGIEDILEVLWEEVVRPVVFEIMSKKRELKGKLKMPGAPPLQDRSRIWWCCMGAFASLPIHAAGVYQGSKSTRICTSDFFVSSYAPTLESLVNARQRQKAPKAAILTFIEPPPSNASQTRNQSEREMRNTLQSVPRDKLIDIRARVIPAYGDESETLTQRLPDASILHFVCNGKYDHSVPMRSGFTISDGQMVTFEQMSKSYLPHADISLLQIHNVETNSVDLDSLNGFMNLTFLMLSLGFRSILAAKWEMNDEDKVTIMKAAYKHLLQRYPNVSMAQVIDDVVRDLRERNGLPASRWAALIHVGI